ncbi:MAG: hypothetical protein A4E63_02534 [Syntrophorhabdus sp. PtaU1.Bin050]|nr:MAG: hypothetical protein A4E63_02534 [Syntrophorhabdus sp. PtaU1.Bin050]
MPILLKGNRLSFAAHRRIDYRNVNRPPFEIPVILTNQKCTLPHVLGVNLMGDVNDPYGWIN